MAGKDKVMAIDCGAQASLSPANAAYFAKCMEKLGFVPNVLRAYAFDDAKLSAFIAMADDLMLADSALSKLEREMIAVVVSSINHCHYCLTAHGAAVRQRGSDPVLGELMVHNYRAAELSVRQKAMLDFAAKLTSEPAAIEEADRQTLRDAGFTVYMPVLFGDPGRPVDSLLYALPVLARGCIAREFHAFRANSSGPIAVWLRGLARLALSEAGGKGVGAIGMCFTGNFALSMMLEPAMLAPVLAQPSLPIGKAAGLHIAPDELAAVKARMEAEDLTCLAYRFEGDRLCRAARFEAYSEALGDRFVPTVIEDKYAAEGALMKNPHSVVTQHLVDEAGQPTRKAVDDILAFFAMRLH